MSEKEQLMSALRKPAIPPSALMVKVCEQNVSPAPRFNMMAWLLVVAGACYAYFEGM